MIELRWLEVPGPRDGAICLSRVCRVLQYRAFQGMRGSDDITVPLEKVWSEWTDVPIATPR